MGQDLVVRISATTQGLIAAFKDAEKQTAELKDSLSSAAKTAGVAFAAFSGIIGGSIAEFRGQELATNQLNVAMKNQGIFSEELSKKYQDMATSLQMVTTFGDEEIISAQAQLQAMIGQNEVTEELTKSILDLASAKGIDLASATEAVGKTIGTSTNALARQGIEIDNTLKGQARLDAVVTALSSKFSGQAEAAAAGSGAFLQLKNAVGEVFEEIGRNLVPILAPMAQGLTKVFATLASNKEFAILASKVLLAGAAISGGVVLVASLGIAFLKIKALMIALGGATTVLTIGFRALAGATGIGLLIVAIGYLALNWEESLKYIMAVTSSWVKQIMPMFMGVGNIIKGILLFDSDAFEKGIDQTKNALKSGAQEFTAIRAKQASDEIAIEEQKAADKLRIEQEQAIKFQEVKTTADQAEADSELTHQERMNELKLADEERTKQSLAEFEYAKANISNSIADEQLARDRQEQLTRLQDEKKYGEELSKAKAIFRSAEFKAVNEGLGNLSTLTASKNKEMFAIGKAASIAQAIINTAEGATKALGQGGIFGPILAATVIAAGAVQLATISSQKLGFAQGGPVYGGIKGIDSVPAMLMPGELVVPEKNFEETIQAVSSSRGGSGGKEMIIVELRGKEGFMDYIETQIVERRRLDVGVGV